MQANAVARDCCQAQHCICLCTLHPRSIQYIQRPEEVFQEIYRVLKPGGIVIFTFSNRMFYQKVSAGRAQHADCAHSRLRHMSADAAGFACGGIAVLMRRRLARGGTQPAMHAASWSSSTSSVYR